MLDDLKGKRALVTGSSTGDVVSLSDVLARRIRRLPDDNRRVLEAVAVAGHPIDQRVAIDAHDGLLARLGELRDRFPPQGRLAVSGHAHIDLAWLWPYAETRNKLRDLATKVDRSDKLENLLEQILSNEEQIKKLASDLGVEGQDK